MDNPYGADIHWLTDEDYAKADGQLRLQLNGVFQPLKYLLSVYFDKIYPIIYDGGIKEGKRQVVEEIVKRGKFVVASPDKVLLKFTTKPNAIILDIEDLKELEEK